ncbi:ribosome small subunit-dependent GTPase A [Flammeovirga sp. MY04]|uniref:ribosome small subunit-dependent GTPase A n=1 Tax=Flammeovirga sp. MY04 TaxID=1191459 RepID=UPI00080641D6|nr:ribosome small subunit-dependent GTPase A [Flammeovirga sp. MY04]ANQ50946.1 ribosome small subunit-dependent GTPase A [Flammeovirga sp. MY04]
MEKKISNASLGFQKNILNKFQGFDENDFARVIEEHKERYVVQNEQGSFSAEITGQLRFTASDRSDFPVVGDWVRIQIFDEDKALIHEVAHRERALTRQAVGRDAEVQYIASNIDTAFIVEAVNRDFNLNRMERYMTLCYDAGIRPVFILNKVDLISENKLEEMKFEIENRLFDIDLICTSATSSEGMSLMKAAIEEAKTYCFLGSSGVGKSSLINALFDDQFLVTGEIGEGTDRGKHTTTSRSLHVLPSGGILIDNPGTREVGMVSDNDGLSTTYSYIEELADQCRFSDCTHTHERGCAVIEAVNNDEIPEEAYQNYLRLGREQAHFESTVAERRKKGKDLARMVKDVKRLKNR